MDMEIINQDDEEIIKLREENNYLRNENSNIKLSVTVLFILCIIFVVLLCFSLNKK